MALKNFSPAFTVKSDIKYLEGKPVEANNYISANSANTQIIEVHFNTLFFVEKSKSRSIQC